MEFNANATKTNATIQQQNEELATQVAAGALSKKDALGKYTNLVPMARGKPSRTWVRRFKKKFQWSTRATGMPGNYRPFSDPSMQAVRAGVRAMCAMHKIPPGLVLNYDQVWEIRHRGSKKKVWKRKSLAGREQPLFTRINHKRQKVAEHVEQACLEAKEYECNDELEKQAPRFQRPAKDTSRHGERPLEDGPRNDPVAKWRDPHTVVTSTWMDGTRGPLVLCFSSGPGSIPETIVDSVNATYQGEVHVFKTGKRTHMMDGALTIMMYILWPRC